VLERGEVATGQTLAGDRHRDRLPRHVPRGHVERDAPAVHVRPDPVADRAADPGLGELAVVVHVRTVRAPVRVVARSPTTKEHDMGLFRGYAKFKIGQQIFRTVRNLARRRSGGRRLARR
jgi:hypothetical protein